jgi:hypothetical protein
MIKIVILGSNGFIGSFLKEYLKEENREIICITRNDLDITNELLVKKWLLKIKPNIIINCAISLSKTGVINENGDIIDINKERNNYLIFQSFFAKLCILCPITFCLLKYSTLLISTFSAINSFMFWC